jgi:hypothetical protein
MQHPCNECKGSGETISDKDRCPQCKGEKVVQEKKVLEVVVEKGMQNGQKITFPGEADEAVCPDVFSMFGFGVVLAPHTRSWILTILLCFHAAGYCHWGHHFRASAEGASQVQAKG